MPSYVALLYSIVLGDGRRVIMSDLRDMAEGLGLERARTLVATGNLVFEAAESEPAELETKLEAAFVARFGKRVDIIVREGAAWQRLVAGNPFPAESALDGSRVMVRVNRQPITATTLESLAALLVDGERIAALDGDLWASFPGRASDSRLLRALVPRRLGIGTSRNWNTVLRLGTMLAN